MTVLEPILLLTLALAGYLLFYILHIPTPAFLGPFAILSLAGLAGLEAAPFSNWLVLLLQSMLGANIGVKVTRQIFQQMKDLKVPSLIMIGWTLFLSFGLGLVLVVFFQLDVATALLSATPSGVSEMGLLALALDGNVGIVMVFQLSRLLIAVISFPIIVERMTKNTEKSSKKSAWSAKVNKRVDSLAQARNKWKSLSWPGMEIIPYGTTFGVGLLGAVLGTWLNIPAGALMGAFFITGASVVAGIPLKPPTPALSVIMQMGIAVMLALNIMNSPMESLSAMLMPTLGFSVIIYLGVYGMYKILRKATGWDPASCLLAAAPVGLTPMSILAYDYAERPLEVVLLHMTRVLVGKLIIIPVIIALLV